MYVLIRQEILNVPRFKYINYIENLSYIFIPKWYNNKIAWGLENILPKTMFGVYYFMAVGNGKSDQDKN